MEVIKDYGPEPVRRDLGILVVLVTICPLGFLMWVGLLSAVRWSLLAAWGVAVGTLSNAALTATAKAGDLCAIHAPADGLHHPTELSVPRSCSDHAAP